MGFSAILKILALVLLKDEISRFYYWLAAPSSASARIDARGRHVLGPSWGQYVILALLALMLVGGLGGLYAAFFGENANVQAGFGMLIFPLLVLPLAIPSAVIMLSGARYGPDGIVFTRVFRKRHVRWEDVRSIVETPGLWTHIHAVNGQFVVLKYWRGFQEFLQELRRRRIPGADRKSLENPHS